MRSKLVLMFPCLWLTGNLWPQTVRRSPASPVSATTFEFHPKAATNNGNYITLAQPVELLETPLYNDKNLIAYWRFEGNALDTKGIYNGTASNVTYGTAYGEFGQGASLNGTNNLVSVGQIPFQTYTTGYTITVWMNAQSNEQKLIFGSGHDDCCNHWQLFLRRQPGGNVEYATDMDTTPHYVVSNGSLGIGQWHMLTVVSDGAFNKIYIDGMFDNQVAAPVTNNLPVGYDTRWGDMVGWGTTPEKYFNGYLDDGAIFSRALTDAEISNLYTGTWPGATGNIIANTNLPSATFTITGPATYIGNGASFTQGNAPTGAYTITYGVVAGYYAPSSSQQFLTASGNITFTGAYQQIPLPNLYVDTPSLSFSYILGNTPSILNQVVHISSTNTPVDVLIVPASSGAGWLSVSRYGGTTPFDVQVTVNTAGLTSGVFEGGVAVVSVRYGIITIPITLVISSSPPVARLIADPPSISFSYPEGTTQPQSAQLELSSNILGQTTIEAWSDVLTQPRWLNVTPTFGVIDDEPRSETSVLLTVSVNGSLPAGQYSGNIIVGASTASLEVPVYLEVSKVTPAPPSPPPPPVKRLDIEPRFPNPSTYQHLQADQLWDPFFQAVSDEWNDVKQNNALLSSSGSVDPCYNGTIDAIHNIVAGRLVIEPVIGLGKDIAANLVGLVSTGSPLGDLFLGTASSILIKAIGSDHPGQIIVEETATHVMGYVLTQTVNEYVADFSAGPLTDQIVNATFKQEPPIITDKIAGDNLGVGALHGKDPAFYDWIPATSVQFVMTYNPYSHFITAIVGSQCTANAYLLTLEVKKSVTTYHDWLFGDSNIESAMPVGKLGAVLLPAN